MSTSSLSSVSTFTITPLPPEFVHRVRTKLVDDFGRAVRVTVATGGEPLRDQLRRAEPGERIVLCSYQAVALPSEFAEIGPVFISADGPAVPACTGELPPGYFNRLFAVRAYDAGDRIVQATLVEPSEASEKFRALLAAPGVAYLHARFAGHGCYAARVERDA